MRTITINYSKKDLTINEDLPKSESPTWFRDEIENKIMGAYERWEHMSSHPVDKIEQHKLCDQIVHFMRERSEKHIRPHTDTYTKPQNFKNAKSRVFQFIEKQGIEDANIPMCKELLDIIDEAITMEEAGIYF